MKIVEVYWSHQSPYCYFALDRILQLGELNDVQVELKLVLPGVLRNPEVFYDAPLVEQRYFYLDTQRTAEFLGLPYGEAQPYPIEFQPDNLYRATENQPRVFKLYYLTAAANETGHGWAFLNQVTRLIWDGKHKDWHKANALQEAIEKANIDYAELSKQAAENSTKYDSEFAQNHERLLETGHNGVPTFGYKNEPFFGQDRFDQLLWRMGISLP